MRWLQVLNRILEHVNVGQSTPFSTDVLDAVQGYNGEYTVELTGAEQDAVRLLRKAFNKPLRDLDKMLTVMGMDELFPGLPTEI